jgi:hypothetical protein
VSEEVCSRRERGGQGFKGRAGARSASSLAVVPPDLAADRVRLSPDAASRPPSLDPLPRYAS